MDIWLCTVIICVGFYIAQEILEIMYKYPWLDEQNFK